MLFPLLSTTNVPSGAFSTITVYDETLDDYVPYDHDNITPDYIKDVVL